MFLGYVQTLLLFYFLSKINSKDDKNQKAWIFYFRCTKIETVKKKDGNIIELNEKNMDSDTYDPYKNRKVEHPTT